MKRQLIGREPHNDPLAIWSPSDQIDRVGTASLPYSESRLLPEHQPWPKNLNSTLIVTNDLHLAAICAMRSWANHQPELTGHVDFYVHEETLRPYVSDVAKQAIRQASHRSIFGQIHRINASFENDQLIPMEGAIPSFTRERCLKLAWAESTERININKKLLFTILPDFMTYNDPINQTNIRSFYVKHDIRATDIDNLPEEDLTQ